MKSLGVKEGAAVSGFFKVRFLREIGPIRRAYSYSMIPWDSFHTRFRRPRCLYLQLFDKDGSGRISTQELVSGLSLVMNAPPKKRREMVFKAWDNDGDGSVDMGEFVSVGSRSDGVRAGSIFLLVLLIPYGPQAMSDIIAVSSNPSGSSDPRKTSEALFKELDTNNDGKLSFSEFEKAADRANSL